MSIVDKLLKLSRETRRAILLLLDAALLALALWLSFSIRYGAFFLPPSWSFFWLLMVPVPLIGLFALEQFGVYRIVTRYIGEDGFRRILVAVSLTLLVWALIVTLLRLPDEFPRSSLPLFWLLANALLIGSRLLIAAGINRNFIEDQRPEAQTKNTIIYGAGIAGYQLANTLKFDKEHRVVAFIDDDETLWGQWVGDVKVQSPRRIDKLIRSRNVKEVFLALPSASYHRRQQILDSFEPIPITIKTVPSADDIASGRMSVNDVLPVSFDDLLGRDPVPPDESLLKRNIERKAVLITGAGGTIGSELARQALGLSPKCLVLFDLSEAALVEIETEIRDLLARQGKGGKDDGALEEADTATAKTSNIEVVSVIGSVLDDRTVRSVIRKHNIATIYHAAAYKHVPIVELNPVAGIANNAFGTRIIVKAARDLEVERFVLVSTDKAVRPTNVMGASKRLAELILQANAAIPGIKTTFSMVRFGNVLASSGSVVRRFNQQIAEGGPVTVTHPSIVRYFMSIREAAQLVIAAGAMAKGGEVFVLDMGQPVRIDDLARMMIRLSGLTVSDGHSGDIAIEYTGLRPGEKLFEELLIDGETVATEHSQILKINENHLPIDQLRQELDELETHIGNGDINALRKTLLTLVEGYKPSEHLYQFPPPQDQPTI